MKWLTFSLPTKRCVLYCIGTWERCICVQYREWATQYKANLTWQAASTHHSPPLPHPTLPPVSNNIKSLAEGSRLPLFFRGNSCVKIKTMWAAYRTTHKTSFWFAPPNNLQVWDREGQQLQARGLAWWRYPPTGSVKVRGMHVHIKKYHSQSSLLTFPPPHHCFLWLRPNWNRWGRSRRVKLLQGRQHPQLCDASRWERIFSAEKRDINLNNTHVFIACDAVSA